jgi:hypothetical protein
MRRAFAGFVALCAMAGLNAAHAVSTGHYSAARQHCSGTAESWVNKGKAEPNCYTALMTVSDNNGHEYFGAGGHQTGSGFVHVFDVWVDPGQGTKFTFTVDTTAHTITPDGGLPSDEPAADPSNGLLLYFGADDNLDGGEHDGAPEIGNGPSDGGGVSVKISRDRGEAWAASLQNADMAAFLASPLPIEEAGAGGCADGICFPGVNAVKTTIFRGGAHAPARRMATNYAGKVWPPNGCSGASQKEQNACVDAAHPNGLIDWFNAEGDVYLMPGINVYEDPDPQKSAIGPYPLPAFSFGPCGFVFGGGAGLTFSGPGTNSAGQAIALNPACAF